MVQTFGCCTWEELRQVDLWLFGCAGYFAYNLTGYGATTLPALTEALTIEKNTTLAEHEAHRLKQLIDKLAKHIEV